MTEGLRRSDLTDMIDPLFTIDQFQSKMGNDEDVLVLRFRAADKEPAIDLMEFVEKGYPFVLDADMSSGEEKDGKYSIFIEIERNSDSPTNIEDLLSGIGQLCACDHWKFRWYKDFEGHEFTPETIEQVVPLTADEYLERVKGADDLEISEFFDQGAIDEIAVDESYSLTFKKPFAESLQAKLVAIGDYNEVKDLLTGGIQLDEDSQSQVLYLNKYLGNYDINKIDGQFLIRNGNKAVILDKNKW